jgi:glyoxylase-like metal-dependent hydrolase (beta-lactamase superfamily II)
MTAAPGERLRRPAGLRSVDLGSTRVSYVPDGAVQLVPHGWFPDTTEQSWAEHPEYVDDSGHLVGSIGGLLIEQGDRAVLIDAGFGPDTWPATPGTAIGVIHGGALLDNLAELGRQPGDIETVAFTHLHVDHLGWAWHPAPGSDKPAFTRAEYLLTEPEWSNPHLAEAEGTSREILDVLRPRVRTVADGNEIFPGVRVQLTEGHTIGHAAYIIEADGRRLIAFGDALHSPIQIAHPEWWAAPDHDRIRSTAHRHRLIKELSEPATLGFGIHFADVPFGRVEIREGQPGWQPAGD